MEDIIIKYLNHTITDRELKSFEEWLSRDKKNELYFKAFIKDHYLIDAWSGELPDATLPDTIRNKAGKKKKRPKVISLIRPMLKYAAIMVAGLGVYYMLFIKQQEGKLDYSPDLVTLKLSDGTVRELRNNDQAEIADKQGHTIISQQENRLDYLHEKSDAGDQLVYNELTVPRGRRFNVLLSDSTEVFLNSGSTLRFPVSFRGEKQRQVYLKGEGFFAVSKNPDKPFFVRTENIVVQVLGTRFNVKAYDEENVTKTSLQEGSVQVNPVNTPEKPVIIVPGEAASYHSSDKRVTVENISIENDIAWTNNRLVFISEPFSEVIKKIERSYGVRIVNKNKNLENVRFYGDFNVDKESVEDVLKAFTTIKFFEYTLKGDLVTIKK